MKNHYLWLIWPLMLLFPQGEIAAQEIARNDQGRVLQTGYQAEPSQKRSLTSVLQDLKKEHNVEFLYREDIVKRKLVALPGGTYATHDNLEQKLKIVLERTGLRFVKIDKGHYAIVKQMLQPAASPGPTEASQQETLSVKGNVKDEEGIPLPGVSVTVKGAGQGTSTDADGNYELKNIPEDAVLEFSFLGYKTLEEPVNERRELNVGLQEDLQFLDQVLVVGYGTQKRSDLTGAISSVSTEDLKGVPMVSIDQGLGGRASGVMVTQTSGMPGATASIRIRGSSSLQGGNEPLYVIDGFPVYSGQGFGNTGGNARVSGLSTINPSDIASIEILKDASATAIYGARAANGVVLITTKTGQQGRDRITFDASYGVQKVVQKIDVMNGRQYAELVNEAYENDGFAPIYDQEELAAIGEGTDWQEEMFQPSPMQNYQLSFSGGDEKTTYLISGGYSKQDGIILNSGFTRYSGRINLKRKLTDKFSAGTSLTLTKSTANAVSTDAGGQGGVVTGAMKFNPVLPVYANAETGEYTQLNIPGILIPNPVATALEQVRENQTFRLLGNVYAEWDFLPNLKGRFSFGLDVFNNKSDVFIPSNVYESNGIANATINNDMTYNWLNENTVTWSKTINEDHAFTVLGGVTFQQNLLESVNAGAEGFVNDELGENALGSGSVYRQPGSSATEWSLVSFLARVNYNFREKYLFSLNGRMDGSSRFGKNNKYAFFPSAAFAWRLSEDDFIRNLGAFSELKLRTSYGFTGNQEIGIYSSLSTLTNTNYTIGRALVTGVYPNSIPNPDLKWEKTAQFDVGADIGVLDNRLMFTVDYYHKKTTDLIYSVALPYVSGFDSWLQNIGSVQNQGLELAMHSANVDNEAFTWTTDFNISFNRSKVLELGGETYKDVGGGDGHLKTGPVHRLIVGEPIGLFYGYQVDGIFQDESELAAGPAGPTNWVGGRRYKDISGPEGVPDGRVEATYDRTVIGDPNPDFFGGFTNTFGYKGFQLSVFLQYSYGYDLFNYNAMELELPSGGQNVYADLVNRWTPENPSNEYPKATTNRSAVFSDRYVEDASYLKLKNLSLSYQFDKLDTKYLENLRISLSAQNLATFTDYRGYDPEVSYRGVTTMELGEDFGGYPQARTFLLGVTMNLK